MGRGKSKKSEDTVKKVVDATLRVVHDQGPGAVSVRTVAREAGLATGTVTYHFKNREALIERCFDRYYIEFRKLQSLFTLQFARPQEPREVAAECVRTLFGWAVENREMHRLRLQTTFNQGGRDKHRFRESIYPSLEVGSRLLAPLTGRSEEHLRLFLLSISNSVARAVTEHEDELRQITGAETLEQAFEVQKAYYVDLTLAYLFGDGPRS